MSYLHGLYLDSFQTTTRHSYDGCFIYITIFNSFHEAVYPVGVTNSVETGSGHPGHIFSGSDPVYNLSGSDPVYNLSGSDPVYNLSGSDPDWIT